MKLFKVITFFLMMVAFASCYKYKVVDLLPNSGTGGNGSLNCKDCNYFPTCSGSRYITNDTVGGTITPNRKDSLVFVKDTLIDGLSCRKILYTNNNSNVYYNCTSGTTTMFAFNAVSGGGATATKIKRVLLKANSPVGTTWNDTLVASSTTAEYRSEIVAKGLTINVNGKVYTDVIEVEVETGTTVPIIGYIATNLQTMYYAKDIGLVYNYTEDLFSGTQIQSNGLVSHYIP